MKLATKNIITKTVVKVIIRLSVLGLVIQFLFPIRNTFIKFSILLLLTTLWLCILYLGWRNKRFRYIFLGLTGTAVLFCCMPSRQINEDHLRQQYVHSLAFYESRPYVWGAENFIAVDCSGLIRQGYIDACAIYALKTFNGALLRKAILLWWYDSSAKAMRDEYRGRTKQYMNSPSINQLDHDQILPGDFAVTQSGVHCLAYLGEGNWIQADPSPNKVTISKVPVEDSGWFQQPIYIMRWAELK